MGVARSFWRCLERWSPADRLFERMETTGIVVVVGPNGSGKSLAAVASLLRTLHGVQWECFDSAHHHHGRYREHAGTCAVCSVSTWARDRASWRSHELDGPIPVLGLDDDLCDTGRDLLGFGSTGERLVYSTVELLDGRDPHPLYRPLTDYRQLLGIEHADVLFDEVAGVSDASDSGSIPVQVVNWLHQLRKRDVRLRVTTPAYGRCSKPIRQVAQMVVDCRSFFPERAETGRLWRPRQAFALAAFDAFDFEDFTSGTRERLTPEVRGFFWRPGHEAETRYSTLGQVLALGHVSESGMCMVCGGQRRRPTCACKGDGTDLGEVVEVVEQVSSSGARTRVAVIPHEHDH